MRSATAAVMARASGRAAVPATRTVGVPLTPRAVARSVTYDGQSRYGASDRQAANAAPSSPAAPPGAKPARHSLSPGPPSGGWLTNSACAYSANSPWSAAQPDAAAARVE